MITILDLLKSDGFEPRYKATTNGGEYASPCPGCGGDDRFLSWPNQGRGGRWWCRQCEKSGDTIQYLLEFHQRSFRASCAFLENTKNASDSDKIGASEEILSEWTPSEINPPSELWQSQAFSLIEQAELEIWNSYNNDVREWLEGRGLMGTTLHQNWLGWNPRDIYLDRAKWGLPEKTRENRSPVKFRIPAGLVIPCFRKSTIHRIFVRRSDHHDFNLPPKEGERYFLLAGSLGKTPLILGKNQNRHIVIESDLDAMLIYQEAGDLISAISMGSAANKPDAETYSRLSVSKRILVALDRDQAGIKSAWKWWLERFPNAKRWPSLKGKDPGEDYRAGVNIRDWIRAGIED